MRPTWSQSEGVYREALAAQQRVLGPEHPDSLLTAGNLVAVLRRQKNFTVAAALCRETLDTTRPLLRPDHPAGEEWAKLLDTVLKEAARAGQ